MATKRTIDTKKNTERKSPRRAGETHDDAVSKIHERTNKTHDDDGIVFKTQATSNRRKAHKGQKAKIWTTLLVIGGILTIGGLACLAIAFLAIDTTQAGLEFPQLPTDKKSGDMTFSALTGEPLADASLVNAPAYCIQTPNGMDGARPQAGLNQAGVVFEAIAEAGITRFAAIYQNPTAAVIGPIRSLRIYYLEWDTPFDCTIVHAGGSGDALAALQSGGYKDLTEDYTYMYRGTVSSRLWNNLFTTSEKLAKFSQDSGYTSSNIKGFARMTPDESAAARVEALATEKLNITQPATGDTSALEPEVSTISLRFGGYTNFNVEYSYDAENNKYLRSYQSGLKHEVYDCPEKELGEVDPESACTLTEMAPSVVVAMIVQEGKASDDYHEDIQTLGSGEVYIFQNGSVVQGRWTKGSIGDQIKFTDTNGQEIKLAPGQTFITAVPQYGAVEFI